MSSDPSGKFEVVGNEIRVKTGASLDYETATSHHVNVTVTDAGGLTRTETVNIAVTNQNETPTDITVAGGSVQENAAAGTVVATLGATDPDAGSTFTYTLSSDPSGKFEIVGDEIRLKAGASLDHEAAASHQVNVTVTDAGGLTRTETVNIAVTNQNEAPTDITVAGGSVAGERRGRHRRRHAGSHRPGCRVDLHLYVELRPVRQVRGRRQRGSGKDRRQPRL